MEKNNDPRTLKEAAADKDSFFDSVRIMRYISDSKLDRYDSYNLKEYIKVCCKSGFLIEAYTIVIQYVEEILVMLTKNDRKEPFIKNQLDAPVIMESLLTTEIANKEFYNKYRKIVSERNKLAHKIIDNPNLHKKLIGDENKTDELISLIDEAHIFTLDYLKKYRKNFQSVFSSKERTRRENKLIQFITRILMNIASEQTEYEPDDDKNQLKKKLINNFWQLFENTLRLKQPSGL